MRLILTDAAQADIEAIGDYVARDAPDRAAALVRDLDGACERLTVFPRRYRLLPGHEETGIRRCVFGRHLILYRVLPAGVEIVRVFDGAMDYPSLLFDDGA
ncbi:MAG: type II toxin-antitoxin system RelE/ParE family toxin [Alphaproteobacteria bacterium]|jgi:plasmid stabilization system protein ParE|nr:type II toxin-antitoxin system RelE/ParE family toxin [Alphaproteobacteria bacterium]